MNVPRSSAVNVLFMPCHLLAVLTKRSLTHAQVCIIPPQYRLRYNSLVKIHQENGLNSKDSKDGEREKERERGGRGKAKGEKKADSLLRLMSEFYRTHSIYLLNKASILAGSARYVARIEHPIFCVFCFCAAIRRFC